MVKQQKTTCLHLFAKLCPCSLLWKAGKVAIRERRLPATARQGTLITLLGLFCPLFWGAYFSGASRSVLIFHAVHSGIFIAIGLVLICVSLVRNN